MASSMVMLGSAVAGSIGRIEGEILGRIAGETRTEDEDMLERFLEPRPPRDSCLRIRGLMVALVGEAIALVTGAERIPFCAGKLAEPGVLRGPSLGVLRAGIRGVEQSSAAEVSMCAR
jgi:hypothetical protein